MYPIVVVLLDGLADRAHDVLKGRTANEAARTPNLDRLRAPPARAACSTPSAPGARPRARSRTGRCSATGPTSFPGARSSRRSAAGRTVSAEHVFAYAALRPAERRDDGWWLTGRPDPKRDAADAQALVEACDGLEVDRLPVHARRTSGAARRSCASRARPTSASPTRDAFFRDRHPVLQTAARSCPRRSEPRAPPRSGRAGRWSCSPSTRSTKRRAEDGLPVFNVITLKWWGRPQRVPTFDRAARPAAARSSASRRSCAGSRRPSASTRSRRRSRTTPRPTSRDGSTSSTSGSPPATRSCSSTRRRRTRPDTRRIRSSSVR